MDQYSELNYDIRKKFLYPAIEKIVKDNMIGRNSLLDYGCGPGDLTPRLVSGFDRMVLTDTSSAALELSRKRFPENVRVVLPDELLKSREQFDIAILSLVVSTIKKNRDVKRVLRNIFRLLKSKGRLIVATTHPCFTFSAISSVPYKVSGGEYMVALDQNIEVNEYHRPLEVLLNLLLQSNFKITVIKEVYDKSGYYLKQGIKPPRFSGKLPVFIIIVCEPSLNK